MSLLIHKDYLGMGTHALLKDSMISWTKSEDAVMTYGFPDDHRSIEPLFKIFDCKIPELVPEKFRKAMQACNAKNPFWSAVIPKSYYNKKFKEVVQHVADSYSEITGSSYYEVYTQSNQVFDKLKSSRLNTALCKSILKDEDNHVIRGVLSSSEDGYCAPPIYDRASTKTGRLTITKGPQVLTLKKEYRSVFQARCKDSKIYEVDFSSLEPRVASNIARREPGDDVYSSFMEYAGINISRDAAKLAVLCSLYGAGKYSLEKQLKAQDSTMNAAALLKKVSEYFLAKELSDKLRDEFVETDRIENYFGRPIVVDDPRPTVLLNNYLQSTAVDVSLLGFEKMSTDLSNCISPLFIIHDAMFFEAKPSSLTRVNEYLSKGFEITGLGRFPLKVTEFVGK